MNPATAVRLVAIVGGSASGKSWLANRLAFLLGPGAGRLAQDDFYRDWSHLPAAQRTQVNFDHPEALDWAVLETCLRDLRAGRAVRPPRYDFCTHCRLPDAGLVPASRVMIVDGLWLLHRPGVRQLFDLTVFLHCPAPERLRRRIARDVMERGRTAAQALAQFEATVAPMHERYVEPQAPHADVVLQFPIGAHHVAALRTALAAWCEAPPTAAALPLAAAVPAFP